MYEIILLGALQHTQVCRPILDTPRSFARYYKPLLSPSFHVAPPKHLVSRPLANVFGVVTVVFEQIDDSRGEVVQKCVVWDELVHELQEFHTFEN